MKTPVYKCKGILWSKYHEDWMKKFGYMKDTLIQMIWIPVDYRFTSRTKIKKMQ